MTESSTRRPPLPISDRHRPSFVLLSRMPQEQFDNVAAAFEVPHSALDQQQLAASLEDSAGLDADDALAAVRAATELSTFRHTVGMSADRTAQRVAEWLDLDPAHKSRERFVDRAVHILECSSVRLLGKAASIGYQHERLFVDAQVLTDLRPVFEDDISDDHGPLGAVLSHLLRLHIIGQTGTHEDVYVALDDGDIATLREALDRAERKSALLRGRLQNLSLTMIDMES